MRNRTRHGWRRWVNWVNFFSLLIALFVLLPMYWLVASSFKTTASVGSSPPQYFPIPVTTSNYQVAFGDYTFGRYILNSLIVACCATTLVLVLGILAGTRWGAYQCGASTR